MTAPLPNPVLDTGYGTGAVMTVMEDHGYRGRKVRGCTYETRRYAGMYRPRWVFLIFPSLWAR